MIVLNKEKLRCPECGSTMSPCVAVSGGLSDFWVKCNKRGCETYIDTYIPLQHQYIMHLDPARYVMGAGGYGCGKTLWDVKDVQKHILITPKGRTLLGAPTMPQLKPTLKKDFESDFPIDFVKRESKNDNLLQMINDHEVLYRSFDDPHKLRSLNLSRFVILEASGAKFSVFTQLQNRLRNKAATIIKKDTDGNDVYIHDEESGKWIPVYHADWRKGTLETNPDPGWVKSQFLESSNTIYFHGKETEEDYHLHDISTSMSTHIIPTMANYTLPANYIEEQSQGKPYWWIQRYFHGSFSYAEGLVYPSFARSITTAFEIPKTWKRLIAMDFGINDNTHFVFGAIDPVKKICYIYDELVISDTNVKDIVREYRKKLKHIPLGALLATPVMDQRSMSKRQAHDVQKTLGDLFLDEGIFFDPAQMNVDSRVLRTNTLFELGQLKIFNTVTGLIKEGLSYRFPEKDLDKPNKDTNKPEDKFNHGVNALEFLVMELPHNLEEFDWALYNKSGKRIQADSDEDLNPRPKRYNPLDEVPPPNPTHYGGDVNGSNSGDFDYMPDDHIFDPFGR